MSRNLPAGQRLHRRLRVCPPRGIGEPSLDQRGVQRCGDLSRLRWRWRQRASCSRPAAAATTEATTGPARPGRPGRRRMHRPARRPPPPSTAPSATPGAKAISVGMKEFAFVPANVSAAAGKVHITARNDGSVPHELVLLKADRPPGSLPTDGSKAKEDGAGVRTLGETGDVAPGSSKRFAANLQPGAYVMICNLPGHYKSGMYASFTVK